MISKIPLPEEGYFISPQVLTLKEVKKIQDAVSELQQIASTFETSQLKDKMYFEVQSLSGRKGELAAFPGALRKITNPSKWHSQFKKLKHHPKIVDTLKALGLKKPYCVVDQVNFKLPKVGTPFPFHQDALFLKSKAKEYLDKNSGINLVIALDRSAQENGAFSVIPHSQESHRYKDITGYDTTTLDNHSFNHDNRIIIEQNPGDGVFFHPWLAHGSGANMSELPRVLIALWYVDKS